MLICIAIFLSISLSYANSNADPSINTGESSISFEAGLDYVSKYVWRGILINDEPVLQPDITASYKGLNANIWGSIDLTDYGYESGDYNNRGNSFQEVDYTLSYSYFFKKLSLTGGIIWYDFPGTGLDDTKELFISAEMSVPLSPSLTVDYDYDEAEGFYLESRIEYCFRLSKDVSLGLSAGVGWSDSDYNMYYYQVDESTLSDIGLSAGLYYTANEIFTVTPYIKFSRVLDTDLADAVADTEFLFFGLNFLFSF